MLFQTLDDKSECVAVYAENKLYFDDSLPEDLSATWSYAPYLEGRDIQYGSIYAEGATISEVCPDHIKQDLETATSRLKAYLQSFKESKVSLKENCFFRLVPQRFLLEFCDVRNRITQHVLDTREKPKQYDFYRELQEVVTDIKFRPLNIDHKAIETEIADPATLEFYRKIVNGSHSAVYNIFGSVTGRLRVERDSFPALNMASKFRKVIKPQNDWLVTIDMNAAEIRTIMHLLGYEQVDGDLYDWIDKTLFNDELGRVQTKKVVTSWLYGATSHEYAQHQQQLEKLFDKTKLKRLYWDGKYVTTPFGRKIESDEHHAIPYLGQSTFIDLFHRQVIKVHKFLKNKKTKISFLLHDECIIDLADEEKSDLLDIVKIFSETEFGKFKTKVKIGTDFSSVKEIKLKVK